LKKGKKGYGKMNKGVKGAYTCYGDRNMERGWKGRRGFGKLRVSKGKMSNLGRLHKKRRGT